MHRAVMLFFKILLFKMNQEEKLYPIKLYNDKLEELSKSGFFQNWKDKSLSYKFALMEK